jgi:hypothetical protein
LAGSVPPRSPGSIRRRSDFPMWANRISNASSSTQNLLTCTVSRAGQLKSVDGSPPTGTR